MSFHYLKKNLAIPKFFFGLFLALLLFSSIPAPAYAIVYQPGATLDPACLPTDTSCSVIPPITGTDVTSIFQTPIEAQDTIKLTAASTPSNTADRLYNVGSVLYWNGGTISGATGLSALNGLSTSTQTFTTGLTGTDFGIVSSGSTHTFNIPTASSTARGLLSTTDWGTFNNKLTSNLTDTNIFVGNGSSTAIGVALSGDATIANTGVLTISNAVVTLAKLSADAVNSAKIVDGSIALADLAGNSVDTAKIVDATITNADVSATAAILYSKLSLGNSIVLADLTADSVNSSKIIDGSVVAADLAADSVTSAKILDGTITNADVAASAAIALSKLASGTSGQIIVANASGVPVYVTLSGDAAIDDAGALTIANLAITNAKLAADSVTSAKIADGTIAAADLGADSVTTVKILDGNITTAKILDANVTLAKLAGDSVNSSKIVDDTIVNADINASAAIALSKLAGGANIITSLTTPTGSNANGGSISSNVLTLSLADGTNPGLVSTGTQTLAGTKTFSGLSSFTGSGTGLAVTNNATVGGTLGVTGATTLSSTLGVTGNQTNTANLIVNGNTTLGDAGADTLTLNSNSISTPNNLNIDSNTLYVDATNNRVGIGTASPNEALTISGITSLAEQSQGLIVSSTSGFGKIFTKNATGNGIDKFVKLLIHADGANGATTFNDSSNEQITILNVGTASITTTTPEFGTGALSLNGTNQYLTAVSSNFNFANQTEFTVDLWFNATGTSGTQPLITYGDATNNNWQLRMNGTAVEFVQDSTVRITGGTTIASTWHHLALVRYGTSNSEDHTLYLDGVSVGTVNVDTDVTGGTLKIGSDNGYGSSFFGGKMDEIRLSPGIRRYTANFTPETGPYGTGLFYQLANGSLVELAGGGAGGSGSSPDAFLNNGNSFGGLSTLGTNDNFGLAFETNAIERLRIDASGNIGIGTAAPAANLHILSTASTTNAQTIVANALTSGKGLSVNSTATALSGNLANISLTGNNASNTGAVLAVSNTGAANLGAALDVNSSATGKEAVTVTSGATTADAVRILAAALTTGDGMEILANALTSGNLLKLSSTATGLTGNLASLTSSGSNAANTGNALSIDISGGANALTGLNIANTGTGLSAEIAGSVAFKAGTDFATTGITNDAAFGNTSLVRLTGASAQTITGIKAADGSDHTTPANEDGRLLTIMNTAATSATISNSSTGSVATNRIVTGTTADYTLLAGASMLLQYDSTASVWRALNLNPSNGVVASYMSANMASAQTTNIAAGDHIKFGSVLSQYGTDITLDTTSGYVSTVNTAAIGRFTLKAGKTYKMSAYVPYISCGAVDCYANMSWVNSDTNVTIGTMGRMTSVQRAVNEASELSRDVVFTPTTDTRVEFRVVSIGGTALTKIGETGQTASAFIEVIAGNAAITGQMVDYAIVRQTTNETLTAGTDISFETLDSGNIPYATGTGVFTLTAGKTYELETAVALDGSGGTGRADYQWRNNTAGALIGSIGATFADTQSTNFSDNKIAKTIFTPTVNTSVSVRVIAVSGSTVSRSGYSYAKVTQLGTSATTEYETVVLGDFPSGGNILSGILSTYTNHINVTQTTIGQTLTLPNPANTNLQRIVYINNKGTASFNTYNFILGVGESAAFIWNGTAWKSFSGSQAVVASYMRGARTVTQTTGVASGDNAVFTSVTNSFGTDISLNTTTGIITLKAGKTYRLMGAIPNVQANARMRAIWHDNTGATDIGSAQHYYSSSDAATNSAGGNIATAIITPSVDTNVELQFTYSVGTNPPLGGSTDFAVGGSYPWFDIEVIAGNAAVTGQSVDYVNITGTTDQTTGLTVGSPILFNTPTIVGNIPVSAGVFTLVAGKTYSLRGGVTYIAGTELIFQWRNITSNTLLGSAGNGVSGSSRLLLAEAVITPTVPTTVRLEITLVNALTNIATGNGRGPWATITQLGSSAITGDSMVAVGGNTLSGTGGTLSVGTLNSNALTFTANNVTKMTLSTSTGANYMRLNGYGAGTLTTDSSGNVTVSSDARLKTDYSSFARGLESILGLTPASYKWTDGSGLETEQSYTGFVAQNVQDFIPEAVGTANDGTLTLSDRPILAALVNATKELNSKTDVNSLQISKLGKLVGLSADDLNQIKIDYLAGKADETDAKFVELKAQWDTLRSDYEAQKLQIASPVPTTQAVTPTTTTDLSVEALAKVEALTLVSPSQSDLSATNETIEASEKDGNADLSLIANIEQFFKDTIAAGKTVIREFVVERIVAIQGYFTRIFADEVHSKEKICIGNTCVTESDLKRLFQDKTLPAVQTSNEGVKDPEEPEQVETVIEETAVQETAPVSADEEESESVTEPIN